MSKEISISREAFGELASALQAEDRLASVDGETITITGKFVIRQRTTRSYRELVMFMRGMGHDSVPTKCLSAATDWRAARISDDQFRARVIVLMGATGGHDAPGGDEE